MTITLPLSRGLYATISDADADLALCKWSATANGGGHVYAFRQPRGRSIFLHRLVAARVAGREPVAGERIAFLDGNHLNCQRDNLRIVDTAKQRRKNTVQPVRARSGYRGVHQLRSSGRWQARRHIGGVQRSLGTFDTPIEAHNAYLQAAAERTVRP